MVSAAGSLRPTRTPTVVASPSTPTSSSISVMSGRTRSGSRAATPHLTRSAIRLERELALACVGLAGSLPRPQPGDGLALCGSLGLAGAQARRRPASPPTHSPRARRLYLAGGTGRRGSPARGSARCAALRLRGSTHPLWLLQARKAQTPSLGRDAGR